MTRVDGAPLSSEASTNSDVLRVSTRLRPTLVNTIQLDMAMTTMTSHTLGPKAATRISPASTPGKAICTSAAEMMRVSILPPT